MTNSTESSKSGELSSLINLLGGDVSRLVNAEKEYVIELQDRSPCTENCPAGVNVKAYVNLISDRRYREAYEVILRTNPLPGICGRVCTHPCEEHCNLKAKHGMPSSSIKELKRFVADYELTRDPIILPRSSTDTGKKVAIVGSGPAGLTAASDLAELGYEVTVFESSETPGGMLVQGIPGYRLPNKVVAREIDSICKMGVKIETCKSVDNAKELFDIGYAAVLLAAGTMKDIELNIPGIEKEGMLRCLLFLRKVNSGEQIELKGKVLVLGGGSSAFDCARTAKRSGAEEVTIAYRRTKTEMPADEEEVRKAEEEGINIRTLAIPVRVLGDKKVTGMEFLKAELGAPDESGRRRSMPTEGSEFELPADRIITAIGFRQDIAGFAGDLELTANAKGTVKTDSYGQTNIDNLFAAGDVVLGPSTVIDAIASGHSAAEGVHIKLSGKSHQKLSSGVMPVITEIKEPPTECSFRIAPPCLPVNERENNFREINLGFTEHLAVKEASRCLHCASCHECAICLSSCDYKQIVGTIGKDSFLMKCPAELSRIIYDTPRTGDGWNEWKIISGDPDNDRGKDEKIVYLETLTAKVDRDLCIACGRCEEVCAYRAVRVELRKGKPMAAYVEHDVCRSCGACTAVCPTGAITQGPMSQTVIGNNVKSLVRGDTKEEPILVGSFWDKGTAIFGKDHIELMCTRMIRPSTIIAALGSGTPGVLIKTCFEGGGCHYLPLDRSIKSIDDIVRDTNKIIEYIGIDPSRVKLKSFEWSKKDEELNEFSKELRSKGLSPITMTSNAGNNRLSNALYGLLDLSKNKDVKTGASISIDNGEGVGYLALVHLLLSAEGFDVLSDMVASIEKIQGQYLFSSELTRTKISTILDNMVVPKSIKRQVKIALVHSKGKMKGVDITAAERILSDVDGIEVLVLEPQEQIELDKLDSKARVNALDLLRDAEEKGADILVPLSINEVAVLGMFTRAGAWNESHVKVVDLFSLLTKVLLEYDGGCEQ